MHPLRPRRRFLPAVLALSAVLALPFAGGSRQDATAAVPVTKADPSSPLTARFANYYAPAESGLGEDAGEPSIGVNHKTGRVMLQNVLETIQVTFNDSRRPPTAEYKDVTNPIEGVTTLDPYLFTDSATGRTFVSQLAPPCSVTSYTDSDGEPPVPGAPTASAWVTAQGCGLGSNFDHQMLVSGPATQRALSPAYGPGHVVYYCSQVIAYAACSVSRDGGQTYAQSVPAYTLYAAGSGPRPGVQGCTGLHGHIRIAPDGTAYLPNFECSDASGTDLRSAVVVTENDGLTWTIRQIKDSTPPNFDSDPAVAVDGNNRVYVAYENDTSNMMVVTSDDRGATFTPSVDIGAAHGIKNATFPKVAAGSRGRAAVAFLGTPTEAPLNAEDVPENQLVEFDPDRGDPKGGWHLYVSMTFDGGASWTTQDVTPTDPVQRGCIWWGQAEGGPGCPSLKRNLLDFTDITVDKFGRVLVGYADGCVAGCVTDANGPNNVRGDLSVEDVGVIARQFCGRGLVEEYDDAPDGPMAVCARAEVIDPSDPLSAPPPSGGPSPAPRPTGTATSVPRVDPPVVGRPLPSTGSSPALPALAAAALAIAVVARRRLSARQK